MRHTGPQVSGKAFAARSSRMQEAVLEQLGQSLTVRADGRALAQAVLEDVEIDPPLGSAPRKLTFPDGTVFETEDRDAIDAITGLTRGGILHDYERFSPRLIVVVAACLAGIWVIWRYGLDILVSAAIFLTPPALVDQINKGTLATVDVTMADPTKLAEDEQERVSRIFAQLLTKVDDSAHDDHDFQLLFRKMDGIGPNAFALPGGTIVMTDAFVKRFPEDDVLAGVLGHEIGHVVEQHGLRQIYRSLGIYVLIAFLAGDTGPILEDIVLEGNLLLSLAYSREHESSADRFGLRLSHDAGYDPAGLKLFFERISVMTGESDRWFSTHPSSKDRVEAINKFIEDEL
jgi:Zn-dependent protease with chaperone function